MNVAALPISGPASQLLAPRSEADAIISVIERAARDPAVDIDKLQRLMEMREKIEREAAERAFNTAMKAAQAEMRPVSADAENSQTHSKYATYAKLDRALRPIYTKHGFSLSFDEGDSPKPDHIRVLCYVSHDAGFTRTYRKDMPADGKGAKGGDVMTKTHATGAAGSYGSRYLLKGIFNVAVGEDDRDGNTPEAPYTAPEGSISRAQVEELRLALQNKGASEKAFLAHVKKRRLEDIPEELFEGCMNSIAAFRSTHK